MKKVARLIPIVIMVLMVAALSASPVLANPGHGGGHGKGNGGGKGGNNTQSNAQVDFSSNPVAPRTEYEVIGSGLAPDTYTVIGITHSTSPCCTSWVSIASDGNGSFRVPLMAGLEGEAVHNIYQKKGGKMSLKGTGTLTITR